MPITLIYNAKKHILPAPTNSLTLLQFIFLSNLVPARPLCSGLGSCGKCKIKFHSPPPSLSTVEKKLLSLDEQNQNIRLACKHNVQDLMVLELWPNDCQNIEKKENKNKIDKEKNSIHNLFIDVGTTSVAWQCLPCDLAFTDFEKIRNLPDYLRGQDLNPQMLGGADVISRLQNALTIAKDEENSQSIFQTVIYNYIETIIANIKAYQIEINEIYLAGNPSVMALSLGQSIEGLYQSPYFLQNKGNQYFQLQDLPPIWLAPQLSPFIGADAVAGLAYILSTDHPDNFLLADMGTNGEFIFWDRGEIFGASVPLGPAIEGLGMRFGSPVYGEAKQIILSFNLGISGLEYKSFGEPHSICGAAYLSLIHILLKVGLLNRNGHFIDFNSENISTLAKKIAKNIRHEQGETRLYVTPKLYLCPDDIENVLKVKSAFATAVEYLGRQRKIQHFYLGGALGEYIPTIQLENLGFLPIGSSDRTIILGNSALKGLIALNHSKPLLQDLLDKITKATVLDLVADPNFSASFVENMHF